MLRHLPLRLSCQSCRSLGYTNTDWLKESREGAGSTATAGTAKETDRDSVILPCQSDSSQERVHLTARASSNNTFCTHRREQVLCLCITLALHHHFQHVSLAIINLDGKDFPLSFLFQTKNSQGKKIYSKFCMQGLFHSSY